MEVSSSFKKGAIAVVAGILLVAVGLYIGAFCWERESIRRGLEDSLLRTALNIQAIGLVREGKASEAIDLLNSMNESNLVYLMRYDDVESRNPEFLRRKKNVLTAVGKERAEHPRNANTFKSDPEWQQYQRDIDNYIKQSQ